MGQNLRMQFRKMFSPRLLRYYSTPQAALKLWVKHNGAPSTQVPIKGCQNLDDFAEKVKQKLNTNCQVSLFTSLDKDPINSWLLIKNLLKTDLKNNTGESPLLVKLIPATNDSIATRLYLSETSMKTGKSMLNTKSETIKNCVLPTKTAWASSALMSQRK